MYNAVLLLDEDFEELRKHMLKATKEQIKINYESEEYALIQAINAYNETLRSYNLLYERLTEWYSLYFPEINLASPKTLAELVLMLNIDRGIGVEAIDSVINDRSKSESIMSKLGSSMGRLMQPEEKEVIIEYAKLSLSMRASLESLEAYIKGASGRMLPNTSYLTDEKIAAELLSKAGSMERLATFPASTIQLLGAEKALFKHIKFGSKPPKYGVIFKLADVSNSRRDLRGKIARIYAAKIAMGLKADFYSKNFIADKLKADIESSIKRLNATPEKQKTEMPRNFARGPRHGRPNGPRKHFDAGKKRQRPNFH